MMSSVQNEFILLINAYYQAVGLSKGITSQSMFGEIKFLPEISSIRDYFFKHRPSVAEKMKLAEEQGKEGQVESYVIKSSLIQTYLVDESFLTELDLSIDKYAIEEGNDMAIYRVTFQMYSDTLYRLVAGTLQLMDKNIPIKERVHATVNSILNDNYWEGEDVWENIDSVRAFKSVLGFSDEWIYEYAYKMFEA